MKKILSLLMMIVMLVSCSKKVEVKGHVSGANPLDRVEIVEASGVATLPLVSLAVDNKGDFSGTFEAPKNGMYVIGYAGNINMVYLKAGQKLEVSGEVGTFPTDMKILGEAKANNDFLKKAEETFKNYASKIDVQKLLTEKEEAFITQYKKIQEDLMKRLGEDAEKLKADTEVLDYKKMDTRIKLIGLLEMYEKNHGMATANVQYKPSAKFLELKKEATKDGDKMIQESPMYREYLLGTLNADFQAFAQPKMMNASGNAPMISDLFAQFLKTKKELSTTAKDYLFAYIISQADINYQNAKNYAKISKLIEDNVQDKQVKTNLKELQKVLMGFQAGTTPELTIHKAEGSKTNLSKLTGKPTMVFFYASYNPNIAITAIPVLKEMNTLYKDKLNFAFVNLDDTKEQFTKTSSAMLKGFAGENYFVEGGINSDEARKFGLYSFKIPNAILLDKEGKLVGRPYFNLGDMELATELQKLTGIKVPEQPAVIPNMEMPISADSLDAK